MEKLVEVINRICPAAVQTDKRIMSDRIVDSVDLVGMVAEIEEEFGIEIPMEEITPENFDSIDAIWSMIEKLNSGV